MRNWRYWLPGLIFSVVPVIVSLFDASDIATATFMLLWLTPWTAGTTMLLSQVISSCYYGGHWLKTLPLLLFARPFISKGSRRHLVPPPQHLRLGRRHVYLQRLAHRHFLSVS